MSDTNRTGEILDPTFDELLFREAEEIAKTILDRRCDERGIERKTGPDLEHLISILLEKQPKIFETARQRLDVRRTAQRDWINQISPTKSTINLDDLI